MVRGVLRSALGGVGTIRFDASTVIDAPVEKVWEFMSDFGTLSQREPDIAKVDWRPPMGVGSVAVVTNRRMGGRTARVEVKEFEPNRRFRAEVTSGLGRIDGVYEMAPVDGGKTRLSVSGRVELHGALRLLSPVFARMMRKNGSATMENIRRILEDRDPATR